MRYARRMSSDNHETLKSPLLSTQEAAGYLRVNPRTVANWRYRGYGPRFVRIGHLAFYRQKELDEWLEQNIHARTSDE